MKEDFETSPQGLLRCLQALTEEAADMRLARTFAALQQAVIACGEESGLVLRSAPDALPVGLIH